MTYEIEIYDDVVNDKYRTFVFDPPKYTEYFIYGGAGAGKSYAIAQHIIFHALIDDYFRCLYLRKVARTIRNSQFQLFKDVIQNYNLNELFDVRDTDMRITCKHNGNMLIAAGMDDPEKIKSIQDPNFVWMEETTEFTLEDFMQLKTRLRKKDAHNYIICSFNPISKRSWLYDYTLRNINNSNVYVMKVTADDNKHISSDYLSVLESALNYNEEYYNVYRLGEWGETATNKIITNYEVQPFDVTFDCYGIDFGYVNPTALVGVKIDDERRIIYAKELIYQTHLLESDLIQLIKNNVSNQIPIYADSENAQLIDLLYYQGLNISKAVKDVKFGLRLIQSYKVIIHPDSTNLLNEVQEYSYLTDKMGNVVEQPVKLNDHAMDAFRYGVATHISKYKHSENTTFVMTIKKSTL